MMTIDLHRTAQALVADGKGILAADETVRTITKRLDARRIQSTPEIRRDYREMLFTAPGIAEFISGVILQDETIHQTTAAGIPIPELLAAQGIVPGIKVDNGAVELAGAPGERVTEGLDGLRDRLRHYRELGARFAKWRAVIGIGDSSPSLRAVIANAHALARYAALCQEEGLVPIVEPEVLMDGPHDIGRCEDVTGDVLHAVFDALFDQHVRLDAVLLKPNMVIPGTRGPQATAREVAEATTRCLLGHAPAAVPGIVFLSGGQEPVTATRHLNAINQLAAGAPWKLTFSFGRALQDEALATWDGRNENLDAGRLAFQHRSRCASAAALGRYNAAMEEALAAAATP